MTFKTPPAPRNAWAKTLASCGCLLLFQTFHAEATTIREENRYYTDFKDLIVTNDFIVGGAFRDMQMRDIDNVAFEDGKLKFRTTNVGSWGGNATIVLIAGGEKWGTPVNVAPSTPGTPDGVFKDTIATMTYNIDCSMNMPIYNLHSNLIMSIQIRKIRSPYEYRNPCYFAMFNGTHLSVCEYTGYWQGTYRVIASTPAALQSNSSLIKFRVSALGGSDGTITGNSANYNQTDQSPAMLEAHLWENGTLVASIITKDDPFDWKKGPEQTGAVFNSAGNSGAGSWDLPSGQIHTDWWSGNFYNTQNNRDITERGWTGISYQPGGAYHPNNTVRVTVHTFEVVKSLVQPTIFFLK